MKQNKPADILKRYLEGTATPAEVLQVNKWYQAAEKENTELKDKEAIKEQLYQSLLARQEETARVIPFRKNIFFRVAAAASVIFLLGVSVYFIAQKRSGNKTETAENIKQGKDIAAPMNTKARITLANGQTVLLDSLHNGVLATQGNVAITKTADGQIIYDGAATEMAYNTLSNPRGSTVINLTLGDGTKVWLNSESSLKYPVAFSGKERKVSISGEAYFEVAKNAAMPFKVDVAGKGEVEVLGTHFNINAYADEPTINTTLLEGSVQFSTAISGNNQVVRLTSGQQAQLNEEGKIAVNNSADIDEVMAWKNGEFQFKNADLKAIMRQVMRWYDVEVIYSEGVPERFFTADISRDKSLMGMLKILELSKIHFKLDGNKLIVMP